MYFIVWTPTLLLAGLTIILLLAVLGEKDNKFQVIYSARGWRSFEDRANAMWALGAVSMFVLSLMFLIIAEAGAENLSPIWGLFRRDAVIQAFLLFSLLVFALLTKRKVRG